jgi:hypothetical protein
VAKQRDVSTEAWRARARAAVLYVCGLVALGWLGCGDTLAGAGAPVPVDEEPEDAETLERAWDASTVDADGAGGRLEGGGPAPGLSVLDASAAPWNLCTSPEDMRGVQASSVAQLRCEAAACVARSLRIGLTSMLDDQAALRCIDEEAPTLSALSSPCQTCFAAVALCAPRACVQLLGGASNACLADGLPSTQFSACELPSAPSAACATCQRDNCEAAFIACSGLMEDVQP